MRAHLARMFEELESPNLPHVAKMSLLDQIRDTFKARIRQAVKDVPSVPNDIVDNDSNDSSGSSARSPSTGDAAKTGH